MFVDRSKLGRECVKELNKLSSLLSTTEIKHVVIGSYALLMHGFKVKPKTIELICEDKRSKIIPMLFKLGYTVYSISDESVKACKDEIEVHIRLVKENKVKIDNKLVKLPEKWHVVEEKDIWFPTIKTRGNYKAASLELLYLLFLILEEKDNINMILSRKLNLDEVMKLLKLNELI